MVLWSVLLPELYSLVIWLQLLLLLLLQPTAAQRNNKQKRPQVNYAECGERYKPPEEFGSTKTVQFCFGKDEKYCAIILAEGEVKLMEQNQWAKCIPEIFAYGIYQGWADENSQACRCVKDPGTKGPKFEFYKELMANMPFEDPPPVEPVTQSTPKPTTTRPPRTTTPPLEFWAKPDPNGKGCLVKQHMEDETWMTMEFGKTYKECPYTVINYGREMGREKWNPSYVWCNCTQTGSGGVSFGYGGPKLNMTVTYTTTKDGKPACQVEGPEAGEDVVDIMPIGEKVKCPPDIRVYLGTKKPCCVCKSFDKEEGVFEAVGKSGPC